MTTPYIIIIVAGSLYALLFFIGLIVYVYGRQKQFEKQRMIEAMYADPGLAKMDYDFSMYDERTSRLISVSHSDGQLTIDDLIADNTPGTFEEGMEEITGTYKPAKNGN